MNKIDKTHKKDKEHQEHEEHLNPTQQQGFQKRPDLIYKKKIHTCWKSCKDQQSSILSLRLSLKHHDFIKIGFGSKPKSYY